jgi:hypothetical protein
VQRVSHRNGRPGGMSENTARRWRARSPTAGAAVWPPKCRSCTGSDRPPAESPQLRSGRCGTSVPARKMICWSASGRSLRRRSYRSIRQVCPVHASCVVPRLRADRTGLSAEDQSSRLPRLGGHLAARCLRRFDDVIGASLFQAKTPAPFCILPATSPRWCKVSPNVISIWVSRLK